MGGGRPPDPRPFALCGSDLCPGLSWQWPPQTPSCSLLARHPPHCWISQLRSGLLAPGIQSKGFSQTAQVLASDQVTSLLPAILGLSPLAVLLTSWGKCSKWDLSPSSTTVTLAASPGPAEE